MPNNTRFHEGEQPIKAPGITLLAREPKAAMQLIRYKLMGLPTKGLTAGHGQPVVCVPGFGASDRYMQPLIQGLNNLGFAAYGWGHGYNWGMRGDIKKALSERLQVLRNHHNKKVALVGWSLGGVFVREIARHHPDLVSIVFSLGSPINGHPNANNVTKLFNLMNPGNKADADMDAFNRRKQPPAVQCVAIHSKTDGIVAWQCAREVEAPNTENLEVHGSHFAMPCNPEVLKLIAARI